MTSRPASAAGCATWDYSLDADPMSGRQSKAIAVVWGHGGPPSCTNTGYGANWAGTHHLEVRRVEGTVGAVGPDDGDLFASTSAPGGGNDFVHRAGKTYTYGIVACADSACSRYYGDGTGGAYELTATDVATTTTELEQFELQGITGGTAVGIGVVLTTGSSGPVPFFYPSSWASGYSGKLGLYFSIDPVDEDSPDDGTWETASQLRHLVWPDTGWPTGGFNQTGGWGSGTLVAQGSVNDADDHDFAVTYPWTLLINDGTNNRVVLYTRTRRKDGGGTGAPGEQVVSIRSTNAAGTDFGLTCGTSCTSAMTTNSQFAVDIGPLGSTAGSTYVSNARIGRLLVDMVDDPVWNENSDPLPDMLFSFDRPASGSCADTASPILDDVGLAGGAWSGTRLEFEVETSGSPACPQMPVEDYRVTSVLPLPNGDFKVYLQDASGANDHYVGYWDGSSLDDVVAIEFVWDGSSSGPSSACVENPSAVVYPNGANTKEGMFFRLMDPDVSPVGACVDGLDVGALEDDGDSSAIVFARLING